MIKLETDLVKGSGGIRLQYKQLERKGDVALYQRFKLDGKPFDYEVIIIKTKFDPELGDEKEEYAPSSSWGRLGWSHVSLEAAKKRFEKTCQKQDPNYKEPVIEFVLPFKEFSTKELAEHNHVTYVDAVKFIKLGLEGGSVKFVREERRNVRGKATKLYSKA